ncbi:MAG: hypothetical protein CMF31_05210 [Kordiimonas sp.]|nr:hypothetical protein [Kordiimonas sp.]|tara:strand:+ start:669 stop:1028 length:360 start_codon:yes stop_codon:yes gene_type:complete
MTFYSVPPVAKPRMTRRDKWAARPCVLSYRAFKDHCRLLGVEVPTAGAMVTFHMPIPASYSQKRRAALDGTPHTKRPDVDNLLKALLDATMAEDSVVHDIRARKLWGLMPGIEIKEGGA